MAGITALVGLGIASVVGSTAVGVMGSRAAGRASRAQSQAADRAAAFQRQSAQESLAFQRQVWERNQQNMAPWLRTGRGALANLGYLMGIPNVQSAPGTAGGPGGQRPGRRFPFQFPRGIPGRGGGGDGFEGFERFNRRDFFDVGPDGEMVPVSSLMDPTGGDLGPMRGGEPPPSGTTPGGMIPQTGVLGPEGGIRAGGPGGSTEGLTPPPPLGGHRIPQEGGAAGEGPLDPAINPELGAFGSLMQPWDREFEAPTVTDDPGYQFRLQEGLDALERSAAARGSFLTGASAEALTRYGQDYASQEYGNTYRRALGEYQQAYNIFQQNQANQFNRLSTMAGGGQTAAGQLSSAGNFAAGNVGNILMGSAGQIGRSYQDAGAARASGYVGQANAWGNAIAGGFNNLGQLLMNQRRNRQPVPTSGAGYSPADWLGAGG